MKYNKKTKPNRMVAALFFLSCLVAPYYLFRFNPLLFHTMVEGYSLFLAGITYVMTTKTYKFSQNGLLRFLGFSCVGITILKGLHLLTYPGIGFFNPSNSNLSIEFWILGRFLESLVFLTLPLFARRSFSNNRMGMFFGILSGIAALSLFLKLVPPVFTVKGPLPILYVMESIIVLIFTCAFIHFYLRRRSIHPNLYRPLVLSLIFSIGAESCITLAIHSLDFMSFLAHVLYTISGYQIYRGIVVHGLELPFQTIFAHLKKTAVTDPLTGLMNRSGFNEMARQKFIRSMREERRFGLLYLDVDNFKYVNDRFGHPLGDEVLKEIARLLQSAIRGQDIACRLGGDEFAIIAEADKEHLALIGQRIEQSFQQTFRLRPTTRLLGVSIGMAVWNPGDPFDINSLIQQADIAMYQSKRLNKAVSPSQYR